MENQLNYMHTVLEASPLCCLLLNSSFQVIYTNAKAVDLLAVDSTDEVLGKQIEHLLTDPKLNTPLTAEQIGKFMVATLNTGHVQFDLPINYAETPGGVKVRAPEVAANAVTVDGQMHIALYIRDFREQCENCDNSRALRAIEQNLRIFVANLPIPACTFDRNFNITSGNPAAMEYFGMLDANELLQKFTNTFPKIQPDGKDSTEKAIAYIAECFDNNIVTFEFMHIKLSGELLPAEITLILYEWKQEYFALAFIKDLREHYKYKKIEYGQQQKLQAILDSSPLMCVVFDANYKILEVNRKVEDFFGIPDKQVYIKNMHIFSPPFQPCGTPSSEKSRKFVDKALETGHARCRWMYKGMDGSPIPAEETLERVRLDGEDVIILYARDLRGEIGMDDIEDF